jgi:probable phosphoglycerate mutase
VIWDNDHDQPYDQPHEKPYKQLYTCFAFNRTSIMESTRILAIRHGETLWNTQNRIQGHIDIDLNAKGQLQASLVGRAFKASSAGHAGEDTQHPLSQSAALYSSDLARAFNTAAQIGAALALPITQDRRLRERHFGDFEGKTWADIDQHSPEVSRKWRERDPQWRPGEGAESLLDLQARVMGVINDIASKHLGEQIVIVSHGGVMDILHRWATGQGLQIQRTWSLENAVINRLLWTPEQLSLLNWGDNSHLGDITQDDSAA